MLSHLNRRQRGILKLIGLNFILLLLAVLWSFYSTGESGNVAVAVAKSKQMMDMNTMAAPALKIDDAQQIALASEELQRSLNNTDFEFVNAVRMSYGEARYWQDVGCGRNNCAHVTFYNYAEGGTVEAIVNMEQRAVVASWQDQYARPAGSTLVMPKALAIAANDEAVRAILGEIGNADPAMVPMSGWLMDDACAAEWCVDLTFHDPNGTGRIFHVFVNMQQEEVARTFYTRGREDRSAAKAIAQQRSFTDGCHEQYGWEVCWEMTAADGVNFRDARFEDQLIFSSAKIGQVEAWYPSWPGGYRDEIGFAATVPPVGDTVVEDFGDGFEVRQLFTEFNTWPNCICCYRYEQSIRFYEDGSLDFDFVSHGPGCDDLSIYRPFWRIDLDLNGPENDDVWLWENTSWSESLTEFETFPFVDDLSPDGHKLATYDGDLHYRWYMEKTDPLGLDEAYLFMLQFNEQEGAGPITTGPGDTFTPPRQWIDGDALSGENIVLWYIPLLKQKRGGPYWCIPDPEPAFSPCDAILHADPGQELRQPTAEELATLAPTPTPESMFTPTPTMMPAPTSTPRPLEGEDPQEILLNAGCTSCHQIGELGEAHKVGPDLSRIGLLDSQTLYDMDLEAYIRQSIIAPNAILAPNCPNGPCLPNIMPRDYETRLDSSQVETLVQFLLDQQAEEQRLLVPELEQNQDSAFAPKAFPAPKSARRMLSEPSSTPTISVFVLLFSLLLLLGLLIYFRGSGDESSPT